MTANDPTRTVLTADDPAQAEAVREALTAAGIDARVIADDDGRRMEVVVPAGLDRQARQIVERGDWPRLA